MRQARPCLSARAAKTCVKGLLPEQTIKGGDCRRPVLESAHERNRKAESSPYLFGVALVLTVLFISPELGGDGCEVFPRHSDHDTRVLDITINVHGVHWAADTEDGRIGKIGENAEQLAELFLVLDGVISAGLRDVAVGLEKISDAGTMFLFFGHSLAGAIDSGHISEIMKMDDSVIIKFHLLIVADLEREVKARIAALGDLVQLLERSSLHLHVDVHSEEGAWK